MQKILDFLLKVLSKIQEKFLNILFFAAICIVVGSVLVDFYYKYLDRTEYFSVQNASIFGGELRKCGNVRILLDSHADFDIQGFAIVEVVLSEVGQPEVEAQKFERQIAIEKGFHPVVQVLPLSCDIDTGNYFARGSVRYEVRGGEHISVWQTSTFVIR